VTVLCSCLGQWYVLELYHYLKSALVPLTGGKSAATSEIVQFYHL